MPYRYAKWLFVYTFILYAHFVATSLNSLASQIIDDVSSNLTVRTELNRERVYDSIFQTAASLIRSWQLKGQQLSLPPFCTNIPPIKMQVADFTLGGLLAGEHVYQDPRAEARSFGLPVELLRQYVRIPYVMTWGSSTGLGRPAIDYLGSMDGRVKLDVFTGEDYKFATSRRYTGRQPFCWVQENVAWLFSPTPLPWQEVVMRAVLDDQRDMAEFGRIFDADETRLDWPQDFSAEVANTLTNNFITKYARARKGEPADGNLSQA